MTISLMAEVAWCLCTLLLVPLPGRAESGQILFSGAVIEPTCSAAVAEDVAITGAPPTIAAEARQTCARPGKAAAASRIYALTVVRLTSSVPDRVLKYFDGYVKAGRSDAMDPVLLTQTYE
ncbi:hypothetical protein [Rhodanobacter terrae]|uniref:Type 1 fimbrial protein n=1 Tax=Rhodanobacter terrae TaxID=418647 RepID=A0ABW0SX47_9GAMM